MSFKYRIHHVLTYTGPKPYKPLGSWSLELGHESLRFSSPAYPRVLTLTLEVNGLGFRS